MGINIIFKKAGTKSFKEISTDDILESVSKVTYYSHCLKLHKLTGRPRIIFNDQFFIYKCNNEGVNLDGIMEWTKQTRKEILGEYYGKEYITRDDSRSLFIEIELKKIPLIEGC